ncbi:hypothetical protein I546_4779 [Mycobacterium kansasii 732]|nr:hypothetical protein I546_4779 [Mycobacterium kansasii 732]
MEITLTIRLLRELRAPRPAAVVIHQLRRRARRTNCQSNEVSAAPMPSISSAGRANQ